MPFSPLGDQGGNSIDKNSSKNPTKRQFFKRNCEKGACFIVFFIQEFVRILGRKFLSIESPPRTSHVSRTFSINTWTSPYIGLESGRGHGHHQWKSRRRRGSLSSDMTGESFGKFRCWDFWLLRLSVYVGNSFSTPLRLHHPESFPPPFPTLQPSPVVRPVNWIDANCKSRPCSALLLSNFFYMHQLLKLLSYMNELITSRMVHPSLPVGATVSEIFNFVAL